MKKKSRSLDDMLGTGLGDPVPVKGYSGVEVNMGSPIQAVDAGSLDDWLSGKTNSKAKTGRRKTKRGG